METYNSKMDYFSGVKSFQPAQSNQPVIDRIKLLNSRNKPLSIATYDSSTLYSNIPDNKLKNLVQHGLQIKLKLTLLSLVGVIFARRKFKFKLFLNDLWYEPETLCLFLNFSRNYFAEKKNSKNIKFSEGNISLPGVFSKNRSSDMQEQFQSQNQIFSYIRNCQYFII